VNFEGPFWGYVIHKIEEISSVSTIDFINLVGNYHALSNGKPDIDPIIESRYPPEVLAQVIQNKKKTFGELITLGLKFTVPPSQFEYEHMHYVLTLFENYDKGQLPFPGSVSEQPAQIMQIFNVIDALRQEQRKKLENNVKRQHKNQRRHS
jgi:hypothetical protein